MPGVSGASGANAINVPIRRIPSTSGPTPLTSITKGTAGVRDVVQESPRKIQTAASLSIQSGKGSKLDIQA